MIERSSPIGSIIGRPPVAFSPSDVVAVKVGGAQYIPALAHHVAQSINAGIQKFVTSSGTLRFISEFEYDLMANELRALRETVDELKKRVDSSTAELVEMSDRDAKVAIAKYFNDHDGEEIYPSDVATTLRLDYDQATTIMQELVHEGAIVPV